MTVTSACNIGDALITMFGAASAFGDDVSYNYKVLESTAGSALVVGFAGVSHIKSTLGGGSNDFTYDFSLEVFLKEKSVPTADLKRISQAVDTLMTTIIADPTIQGTAQHYNSISGTRDPDLLAIGSHLWWRVPLNLEVEVWSDV